MVFRALTFARSLGRCLNTSPRDPANVNARKNMVDRFFFINLFIFIRFKVRWELFRAAMRRSLSLCYVMTSNVPFEKNKMASTLAATWSVHKMQSG